MKTVFILTDTSGNRRLINPGFITGIKQDTSGKKTACYIFMSVPQETNGITAYIKVGYSLESIVRMLEISKEVDNAYQL